MRRVVYDIVTFDMKLTVYETKRQRDILDVLNNQLENTDIFGWSYAFMGDSFLIEYNNGATYKVCEHGEYGVYNKKGIKRIIYISGDNIWIYGNYEINKYGEVF